MLRVSTTALSLASLFAAALMGCSTGIDAEGAVADLPGIKDVKSCDDTGEEELNSVSGEQLPVYLCTVRVSTRAVASALERAVGLDQGSEYVERCYTVGETDDGDLRAIPTVDRPSECPEPLREAPVP
jgi:hypothetical protein